MTRYIPDSLMSLHNGMQPVTRVNVIPKDARTPNDGPIKPEYTLITCYLANGEKRYFGVLHAYIDSTLRVVGVGFNERDEVIRKWEEPKQ